jgi:pimeloyl-ACP methyl ester carboxylesterase
LHFNLRRASCHKQNWLVVFLRESKQVEAGWRVKLQDGRGQIYGDISQAGRRASFEPALGICSDEDRYRATSLAPMARPRWLPKEVWPFRTSKLEVDGRGIAVTDVGSGPTLLLVHTGLWSFIWRDLVQLLATDFRCVFFDSPGTGLSDAVSWENISFEAASRVTAAVIERLNLSDFTLVVHDLGGPVGIAGASKFAEHVRGIAAINSFAWEPSDLKLRLMLSLVSSSVVRELDVLTNLVPRITASNFGVGLHLDVASRSAFRSGLGSKELRAFHQYMREARRGNGFYNKVSAALSGPFHSLPLLTIFGERNDPFRFQQRWEELFPNARQVTIQNGNHFPMCDDPEFVAKTLRDWHQSRVASRS